ncbi:hypothetical protein PACTADRAFT_47431 [Pachysolen tannophilus NRRL Y-2460]|uniref:Dihydrofolate synthetase n=1 Tax=Pachysolen tannophilus NRRL Y-2460 TaxID=669874 RepID=A0A1E4U0L1_PACTA|nr:hypothetical protein PACTADRAFT_47431 [Pachysolen tannophilus NRRL Y-2460]
MPIDLGLQRVTRLLSLLGNPHFRWKSIHIAGTNGKGSICAYLSSILTQSKIKNGKFTSPHLIRRSDCITINDEYVSNALFEEVESKINKLNAMNELKCTEFEILTCCAFEIFKILQIEVAVIEVGLGGRLDATNVLPPYPIRDDYNGGVIATGIAKIGLDHENILGSTLREIATEKAGIIKENIPCIVDGTNDNDSLQVFKEISDLKHSKLYVMNENDNDLPFNAKSLHSPLRGSYQLSNLLVSLKIIELISKIFNITQESVKKGVLEVKWPGRLQELKLQYCKTKPSVRVLLDGAHNKSATIELSKYLASNVRNQNESDKGLIFIMAITKGKKIDALLAPLIKPQDTVILTTFGKVDGMPWISCCDPESLKNEYLKYTKNVEIQKNQVDAIKFAIEKPQKNIVICGSLYLVGDYLRMHENNI